MFYISHDTRIIGGCQAKTAGFIQRWGDIPKLYSFCNEIDAVQSYRAF